MAVRHIAGVVDVERDRNRWRFVRRRPLIDQSVGQTDDVFQARRVFEPRRGRLRTKIATAVGPTAGDLLAHQGGLELHCFCSRIIAALGRFRRRKSPILICLDCAARGCSTCLRRGLAGRFGPAKSCAREPAAKISPPTGSIVFRRPLTPFNPPRSRPMSFSLPDLPYAYDALGP